MVWPYLLRTLAITRSNRVWAMDISCIPMARGFVYLAAVSDWHRRRVLAWRLSISMDTAFCTEAVEEAIAKYSTPEILNTDQGSQVHQQLVHRLAARTRHPYLEGRQGLCWRDNMFIEDLWLSIEYEEVYLHGYKTESAAREGIGRYINFYNTRRPHSSHQARTPDMGYFTPLLLPSAEAA